MPRGMHFSRRNKGITNYRKRLALLKSGVPRAVVRFSNAKVTVQIIDFSIKGDNVLVSANSTDVVGMGWKGSKTNIPASYLSGMLAAKRALKAGVDSVVLDIGRITPTSGGRAFATLKGLVDGGLNIPHSDNLFPSDERINGSHISDKTTTNFEKVSKKIGGSK
jgi:large subunit ribosomal protein L18